MIAADKPGRQTAKKFLTFAVTAEEYCIDIQKIRAIIGYQPATVIPHAASFIKGVINLRGKVLPVIDLRMRLAKKATAPTETTCIIILDCDAEQSGGRLGIIVDAVHEVTTISDADIELPQHLGLADGAKCIHGIAKQNGVVKIVLDIDKLVHPHDMTALSTPETNGTAHH